MGILTPGLGVCNQQGNSRDLRGEEVKALGSPWLQAALKGQPEGLGQVIKVSNEGDKALGYCAQVLVQILLQVPWLALSRLRMSNCDLGARGLDIDWGRDKTTVNFHMPFLPELADTGLGGSPRQRHRSMGL